mgnify:CR=1 FL=1
MRECVLRADRVLIDGHLVPASVGIAGGQIARIDALDADHSAAQDIRLPHETVLLPGFVDPHVHINDPGTRVEGFASAT